MGVMLQQTPYVTYTSACLCLQESWLVTNTEPLGRSVSLHEVSNIPKTEVSVLPTTRKHCGSCTVAGARIKEWVSRKGHLSPT